MNIFILCSGRCGSVTIIQACKHITNYSSAHESRSRVVGKDRLNYPLNHIEADNRLSWLLGRLDTAYGNDAFYVYLTRDRDSVANSFSKRNHDQGIMTGYRRILMQKRPGRPNSLVIAKDMLETIDANIRLFLKDKTKKLLIRVESFEADFLQFWDAIGAKGDLEKALTELKIKHNASKRTDPSAS